jgi:hypothetical protein
MDVFGMCFCRVVYFLPGRGALERANAILISEMQQLEHAYGRDVFECMVAVATIPQRFSASNLSDEDKFPPSDIKQCEQSFDRALCAQC